MTNAMGKAGGTGVPEGGAPQSEVPDPKLLELLVCPLTKKPLRYDAKRSELISEAAKLAYPIKSGIPLMTVEAARHLDDDEVR